MKYLEAKGVHNFTKEKLVNYMKFVRNIKEDHRKCLWGLQLECTYKVHDEDVSGVQVLKGSLLQNIGI